MVHRVCFNRRVRVKIDFEEACVEALVPFYAWLSLVDDPDISVAGLVNNFLHLEHIVLHALYSFEVPVQFRLCVLDLPYLLSKSRQLSRDLLDNIKLLLICIIIIVTAVHR